jgi:hypothetical protein
MKTFLFTLNVQKIYKKLFNFQQCLSIECANHQDATLPPIFSVQHVSSLGSKAHISARRFRKNTNLTIYPFPTLLILFQDCFKSSWKTHKLLHKLVQGKDESLINDSSSAYNPWPYFKFTGKLRPFPQSATRQVPPQIPRPDYADHFKGHPVSEQKQKNSTQIKVLNDEEIEEMRVACKVFINSKTSFT